MANVGRPKGVSFERKDITLEEFNIIIEFVLKDEKLKELTRQNIIKSFYLLYFFGFRVGELTL